MGNNVTTKVIGIDSVELKFTFRKSITLLNVHHLLDISKNLVSGNLLNKARFKLVYKSNKFFLSKNNIFVEKGYLCNGMIKLNISNKNFSFVYMVDSICLWHSRLGHINYNSIINMSNLGVIPTCNSDNIPKDKICAQTKTIRKPFHKVEHTFELLDLIHTNICDFKNFTTCCGKKYFVAFIDDFSRYTYIYLLSSKDEVFKNFKIF